MKKAIQVIKEARDPKRPTSKELINSIFEDFIEMHGDRKFKDDKAIVGGIAYIKDEDNQFIMPVTVIGIQKGRNLKENLECNFGSPHPEGYRKALRLMKQAEKFNRPVITFINTAGAFCGIGAEERGQGEAIARNLVEMFSLNVPIIAIIIGEGGSGGALALAIADKVFMLENSFYSILSPEGFASILWKDSSKVEEACEVMKLTSTDLFNMKIIDKVIKEPANIDEQFLLHISDLIKQSIVRELKNLGDLSKEVLIKNRFNKYRCIGEYK